MRNLPKRGRTFRHCTEFSETARNPPTLHGIFRNRTEPSDAASNISKRRETFRHPAEPFVNGAEHSKRHGKLPNLRRICQKRRRSVPQSTKPSDTAENLPNMYRKTLPKPAETLLTQCADSFETEAEPADNCTETFHYGVESTDSVERSTNLQNLPKQPGIFRHTLRETFQRFWNVPTLNETLRHYSKPCDTAQNLLTLHGTFGTAPKNFRKRAKTFQICPNLSKRRETFRHRAKPSETDRTFQKGNLLTLPEMFRNCPNLSKRRGRF